MQIERYPMGRRYCGAWSRSVGRPCRQFAMANGRCDMHGGKSLCGRDHPNWKHGLRSKEFLQLRRGSRGLISEATRFLRQLEEDGNG